jgi:5'-nucleotidase
LQATAPNDVQNCVSAGQSSAEALRAAPLRLGISTRALFDLEEEHEIFANEGVDAYSKLQRQREQTPIKPGAGFDVIQRLLALNEEGAAPFVKVVLMSRNSPDLSLRAFNSIAAYGLDIRTGTFTGGRPLGPFVDAWNIDLFLSNEESDVQAAIAAGAAAAKLGPRPAKKAELDDGKVCIAFAGDAVVFSAQSDEIYKAQGLSAFLEHESTNATNPMTVGPFGNFLKKLSLLRSIYMEPSGFSKVRIAIVTARNAPAHARVVHTLRAWGTPADEAHFVGVNAKGPILKALGAHIFFDDQEKHILSASALVPSGQVPGPHDPSRPIIPASA